MTSASFDWTAGYASQRLPVFGRNVVSTSHPLAAQAGLQMLWKGGSAVEGLSVAAVTYYGAGLVGYLAKGAKSAGLDVSPDVAVALAIPIIALGVWLGVRRLHRVAQRAAFRDSGSFK